jgi:phosphoribosylamine--glycine ligase
VDGEVKTSGGRVLGVTALGANLEAAIARAYQAIERIHFDGMYCRRDIGHRALARLHAPRQA